MRRHGLVVAALVVMGAVSWLSAADRPSGKAPAPTVAQASGVQDIIFLDDQRPILLRLHIDINGQPFDAVWDRYMQELFTYLDADGDGVLSPREARRAPSAELIRRPDRGLFNDSSSTATLLEMDANRDGKVTLDELRRYYRRNGAGALQLSLIGVRVRSKNPITDRLFELLDTNKDGKLSQSEVEAATRILRPLDSNDDELVGVEELSPDFRNLFALDSRFPRNANDPIVDKSERFFVVRPDARPGGIGRLLLSRYGPPAKATPAKQAAPASLFANMLSSVPLAPEKSAVRLGPKQIGVEPSVFRVLDRNRDGVLDGGELEAFCRRPADVELRLSLGRTVLAEEVTPRRLGSQMPVVSPAATGVVVTLGRKQIHVRGEPNDSDSDAAADYDRGIQAFFLQQFRAADVKERGYVEMQDLTSREDVFLRTLFRQADRNGDGRLTEQELRRYFDMRHKAIGAFLVLSVADLERGLFEVMDTNRDGALGPRELRQAWTHVAAWDRSHDGLVERSELPQQFQLTVTRMGPFNGSFQRGGYSVMVRRQPPTRGPLWFRKMDRNGDGDVSRREFLGSAEDFRRIDADGDGLIDLHEAERAAGLFGKHPTPGPSSTARNVPHSPR